MAKRKDPEKHKEQVRAANRARYRATQRLIVENQARFDALYAEEAAVEGVTPKPRAVVDADALTAKIAELERALAEVKRSSKKTGASA